MEPAATPTVTPDQEHEMCPWMAWLGQSVLIEELLFKTWHGIVDQSLHHGQGLGRS
jgi:hypothetical protein